MGFGKDCALVEEYPNRNNSDFPNSCLELLRKLGRSGLWKVWALTGYQLPGLKRGAVGYVELRRFMKMILIASVRFLKKW